MLSRRSPLFLAALAHTAAQDLTAGEINAFVPYDGYTGDVKVSGTVQFWGRNVDSTRRFSWSLHGVDPLCASGPGDAANSCGVHIHSEPTCLGDAGGHYYNKEWYPDAEDPWTTIAYTADGTTAAATMVLEETVYSFAENEGKSVIVHGFGGERIACAILMKELGPAVAGSTVSGLTMDGGEMYWDFTPFVPYTDGVTTYSGSYLVSGEVKVVPMGEKQQHISWELIRVDPACVNGPGAAGNSCGVHVHEKGTCLDAAGGHYYDQDALSIDPWKPIGYTSVMEDYPEGSVATAKGNAHVDTQIAYKDIVGKSIIVHGYDGGRIACAIILPKPCGGVCKLAGGEDHHEHHGRRSLLFGATPSEPAPRPREPAPGRPREPAPGRPREPAPECAEECADGCEADMALRAVKC